MGHFSARRLASLSVRRLQASFLAILPRLKRYGRFHFRGLGGKQRKEEALQEMVALVWKWFCQLAKRGKNPGLFVSALASFAARAVKSGRRLVGQEKAKDAMSTWAQARHGFSTVSLPKVGSLAGNLVYEALQNNMQTPVPDQVSFRCDFPSWRGTRTYRDRRVMDDLMVGERPGHVSRKYGMSPARVSQLRREFHQDWQRFCGDQATADICAA